MVCCFFGLVEFFGFWDWFIIVLVFFVCNCWGVSFVTFPFFVSCTFVLKSFSNNKN